MADDAFNKFKKSITKSVVAVNVKTSMYLETSKFKLQISNIEKEIQDQYSTLGKSVYTLWRNEKIEVGPLLGTLQVIQEKYAKIDSLRESIEELEQNESEYFGSKEQNSQDLSAPSSESEVYTCSKCNTQYTTPIKFCKKCGNKML